MKSGIAEGTLIAHLASRLLKTFLMPPKYFNWKKDVDAVIVNYIRTNAARALEEPGSSILYVLVLKLGTSGK